MKTITVTKEDIQESRERMRVCVNHHEAIYLTPVAIALQKAGYARAWTERLSGMMGWTDGEKGICGTMGDDVRQFLLRHDNYLPVEPVTFQVELYKAA